MHVRRGDMQSMDCFLHANPRLQPHQGLAMFFNPTSERRRESVRLNLYYTGIEDLVEVALENGTVWTDQLERDYSLEIELGRRHM